jgi:hypothetical protein
MKIESKYYIGTYIKRSDTGESVPIIGIHTQTDRHEITHCYYLIDELPWGMIDEDSVIPQPLIKMARILPTISTPMDRVFKPGDIIEIEVSIMGRYASPASGKPYLLKEHVDYEDL